MDELLGHMKGYDRSFRREITDTKGDFSQEKLCALVDEMLDLWAQDLRAGRYTDVTDPYLEARLELYRSYLYLVMRCSLCKGAYSDAQGGAEEQERTDFAFLLQQAKILAWDWCVMTAQDGTRRNELYWGFDKYFGFHLYRHFRKFADDRIEADYALTPDYKRPCDLPDRCWTNEGKTRLISFQRSAKVPLTRPTCAEEAEEEEEAEEAEETGAPDGQVFPDAEPDGAADDAAESPDWDDDDAFAYVPADDDDDDDDWIFPWEEDEAYQQALMEQRSEEDSRDLALQYLWMEFGCLTEYLSACDTFQNLFRQAAPEVPRNFYEDLEKIVDLYLIQQEVPPLMDVDKSLNVYNSICDEALRQARRYGRGIQWKGL